MKELFLDDLPIIIPPFSPKLIWMCCIVPMFKNTLNSQHLQEGNKAGKLVLWFMSSPLGLLQFSG